MTERRRAVLLVTGILAVSFANGPEFSWNAGGSSATRGGGDSGVNVEMASGVQKSLEKARSSSPES